MPEPNDFNAHTIEEFRANEGKVGGYFEGATLLLLHTKGAKSALPRTNPLVYLPDGDRYVVIALKGGAPTHPDWFLQPPRGSGRGDRDRQRRAHPGAGHRSSPDPSATTSTRGRSSARKHPLSSRTIPGSTLQRS